MIYSWNSRLRTKVLSHDSAILLSETESFSLAGKDYEHIIDAIENNKSIFDLHDIGLYENVRLLSVVEHLKNSRLIESEQHDNRTDYCLPDFKKNHITETVHTHQLNLIILSELKSIDWKASWLAEIETSQPLTLVVVDDYLDPRLAVINESQRELNRDWLIVKVSGEQILAGPLFHPDDEYTACWQCLADRISRNQPARVWLSRIEGQSTYALPVKIDHDSASKALMLLEPAVRELITQNRADELLSLSLTTSAIQTHPVSRRPQCACCGDPDLLRKQITSVIKLQENPGTVSYDGGYRTEQPQSTLKRLQSHVSPVTGVIANIEALPGKLVPDDNPSSIQIYKSVFFKSPYLLHSIKSDPFVQVCLGKGVDPLQSRASALCEAFERYAAQYQGDEPSLCAVASELDYPAVFPHQLAPFSDSQYVEFSKVQSNELEALHGVYRYDKQQAIHWTQVWSLTRNQFCYLPTTYCFANTPFNEVKYSRWGSNGCAAGNSLEEAILQGFLELIERDAVAIWWYNKIERPAVDLALLPGNSRQRVNISIGKEWDYWVLDISHDLAIPVIVAVGQHKETGKFILGFGCHLNLAIAVERALTELCQLIPVRDQGHKLFNFDDIKPEQYLFPSNKSDKINSLNDNTTYPVDAPENSIRQSLEYCISQAESCGLETLVLNYSRPDIPLFTVNVAIPGLCHMWPQMACDRLYDVPVKLNWKLHKLKETEMNDLKLYI